MPALRQGSGISFYYFISCFSRSQSKHMTSPFSDFVEMDNVYISNFVNEVLPDNPFVDSEDVPGYLSNHESKPAVASCEGRTCWSKSVLNRITGLNLAMNNTLDAATRQAIGDFQLKNNLPVTKAIDAVTERALLEADAIRRSVPSAVSIITEAKTRIEDWTKHGLSGVKTKPKHILNSFRDPRKLWAFVLHQMAFKRRGGATNQFSAPEAYVNTGAHFCIMLDGRIIQLHPVSRMIWHGNCLSGRSVAVEFEGNFPTVKGTWWIDRKSKTQNRDNATQAQFDSGQFLARYLQTVVGTTHILAHRQGSHTRENDPGPDIWFNVGEWAINNLGMTDGGPAFKCGKGNPILPAWRTWSGRKTSEINEENADTEEYAEFDEEDWENETDEEAITDPGEEWEGSLTEQGEYDPGEENENAFTEEANVTLEAGDDLEDIHNPGRPVILARGETTIPFSNRKVTVFKMYDKAGKKFLRESFDEEGNKVEISHFTGNEGVVSPVAGNKLHPALQLQLSKTADSSPVDIAVWLNIDVKEPLKTNYTPEQLATMPPEIAEHRLKLAQAIAETTRRVTIERAGVQVQRVSALLPLFFARASKGAIEFLKRDPLVLGIFFNDRSYHEALNTSLSKSGAAEAQNANMTTLGKDIKVAVWENAPDVITDLTIEGYYDPATPGKSSHARLVSSIIKNKEAGKSKGYAPACKLYSANLSGSDVFAPLEWAVKQGCSVVNRSFHQDTDQVNAGMQLGDFITDALALRYPYPLIVQAAGNTGQPDDTALGISPAANEYVNHKGYNSLAVGSHDEQAERKISGFSTFRNPSSPHSDRELPEICALGENIAAVGMNSSGTSFSSPAVAGAAALLQSISPVIKVYPELTRALLLAGAKRNVDGGLWFRDLKQTPKVDQKDGTGALNIYESITIAKKRYGSKKPPVDKGWDCGRFDLSSFGPDKISTREWKIKVPAAKKNVKVVLAWNSNANYQKVWIVTFLKDATLDLDLDVLIYDEKGTLVAASSSYDNSFEIADYIATPGQTLTIKVRGYSIKPDSWTYFGLAWTTY